MSIEVDLESLIQQGKLEGDFDVLGHTVKIKTLNVGERLDITREQDNAGAMSVGINTKISVLARALVSIDGKPMVSSLEHDANMVELNKRYIKDKFYLSVVQEMYEKYCELEDRALQSFEELKKKLNPQENSSD